MHLVLHPGRYASGGRPVTNIDWSKVPDRQPRGGKFRHGTHTAYVYYCHDGEDGGACDRCKGAHAAYMRKLRELKRKQLLSLRVRELIKKHNLPATRQVKAALSEALLLKKL